VTLVSRFLGFLIAVMLLVSCDHPARELPSTRRPTAKNIVLPPMKTFAPTPAPAPTRSNISIAQEFIPLAFGLESGRRLPVLSRFEGPITIRLTGNALGPVGENDLNQLLIRLRNEAHIPITRVPRDQHANITVQVIDRKTLHRSVPNAACFVVPRIESWAEYRTQRNSSKLDWTTITERTKMAIFLPGDVAPQEVRDCMHEEIAQALGPANDLYHLTDSIFNDDNFHTILTGFDMVVLRAFYDPALHSGMTQNQVATALPAILSRINPRGRTGGFSSASPTTRQWTDAMEMALGARGSRAMRTKSAKSAVQIARSKGWNDNRLGFSLYALGRLALANDAQLSLNSFAEAEHIFRGDPNTQLHAAHVAVQAAAFALSAGQPMDAVTIVDANSPVALKSQNASLLATLLMIKAQALDAQNRVHEADIVRLDSLGWARYGFGTDAEIRNNLSEIAALNRPDTRIASR
jgi:hypothetical protein